LPRKTDRPERLYLRVTEPLRTELEEAAREDGRCLADLARHILRDWIIDRLASRGKELAA
jgi:hypothetical protein